jgi:hypothetical protein
MNLSLEGPGAAHTTSIIAWWNTILYVGGFFACMSYTAFGNRYGRKSGIALGAIVSVIGSALQAGSVNPDMMIVARLIVGAGMGILLPAVPLYQAEIAPPSNRGLLVGIHGEFLNNNDGQDQANITSIVNRIWFHDFGLDWGRVLLYWRKRKNSHNPSPLPLLTDAGWVASPPSTPNSFPTGPAHCRLVPTRKSKMV